MKLRPALSAGVISLLLATAHAVPAYAHHDTNPPDAPTITSGKTPESNTVADAELTEAPAFTGEVEPAEPTAPSGPIDLPAPIDSQDPGEPTKSPVPKDTPGLAHPDDPTESSHPADPLDLPQPLDLSEPTAPDAPANLWEDTYSAGPTEPHAPVDSKGLTNPTVPTRPTPKSGREELAEPTAPAETELVEEPAAHFENVTTSYTQPVARDARLETLKEEPTPQLQEEILTKSVPWKQPEGVVSGVSPVEVTDHSLAQAGAISRILLIGGIMLISTGALLLFWNRRVDRQREGFRDFASSDN